MKLQTGKLAKLAFLVGGLALTNPYRAPGAPGGNSPGPEVTVVNTVTNPVPVMLQGSKAIIGSVAIADTPTVNIAPSNSVSIVGTVQVSNAAGGPVVVRNAEAGEPYQVEKTIDLSDGFIGNNVPVVRVPAGKRFVIEYVSGTADVGLASVGILTYLPNSGIIKFHFVPIEANSVFGRVVKFYAAANSQISCQVTRTSDSGDGVCLLTLSGYLVDVP